MTTLDSKMEIVEYSNLILMFLYVPEGYVASSFTLENHHTTMIGKLNSLNILKIFKHLVAKGKDVRLFYTNKLLERNWDFKKYPNPTVFGAIPY